MISEMRNVRDLVGVLGDDDFVDAIVRADDLVRDADETLYRVELIESEANEALRHVDERLQRVDRTVKLLEAKIEAAFTVGFLAAALRMYSQDELVFAVGLGVLGALGLSSLVVTLLNIPQVVKLRRGADRATDYASGYADSLYGDDSRKRRRR
ncbi:MAG: hypothetical protein ACLFMT_01475 [Halobacteriales archaeon]